MKTYIFWILCAVSVALETLDISRSDAATLGLLTLGTTIGLFLLEFRSKEKQNSSMIAMAGFSAMALAHMKLFGAEAVTSDETFLSVAMIMAVVALTNAFREVVD